MSTPPYMKLYWGDYYRGTRHLRSPAEHGAYLLLIGALWDANGKLPADDDVLARHALCTAQEWAAMKAVIMPFFKVSRGSVTHKRVSEELAKYGDTVRKRKVAGKAGGKAKSGKHTEIPEANATSDESNSRHNQNQNQNQNQKEEIDSAAQVLPFAPAEVGSEAASPKRGVRLKPDWRPGNELVAFALREGFTEREVDQIAAKFRDYWTAASGKTAVKLDWPATWRNWVRNEAERRGVHGASPRPKRQGFV